MNVTIQSLKERIFFMIYLRAVDNKNREDALKLRPSISQESFIESVGECLLEADELSLWNPVVIYQDEEAAGFAMFGFWKEEGGQGRMWLDRFLIDEMYQGRGIGKEALRQLVTLLMRELGHDRIFLSLYEDNKAAERLYRNAGFRYNGEKDTNGELVMVLENVN